MKSELVLASCVILAVVFPGLVHPIVPPKTPVLSGFEPAAIGSYCELICDASQPGAGTITYKWYKYSIGKYGVEDWESKGPIGTSQKYFFSPVTENRKFHSGISSPEPVSGKYKCRASNSAGTRDSEWGDLFVYTPCSLYTVSVSPAKHAIGSTFTLHCHIPNPSGFAVNWLKKADASSASSDVAVANSKGCQAPGNPRYSWSSCSPPSFSSKTHTFNLNVTNTQPSDSAYWMCKDISLSCNSNPVKPIVQAPPGTPIITGFPSRPVTAGTQLNLKCVASPPGDTYDWYKDGTKVATSLSYDFLVIKESAGVYNCMARNDVGSATSSDKTLVVYYKADSVVVSSGKTSSYVGETDRFTCTVTGGSPTPNIKIYFKKSGGTPVEVTQGQDRVMAKEDNQAEYYCEAKVTGHPALDVTSSTKTYNVTFPNSKVSFLNNPGAAVQHGQVKKFTCETDESNPITYMKCYQSTGSSWQVITTGISSSERNGVYGGKIRISEWSVTATKDMNVNPSKITMTQKPSTAMIEGKVITITCETDSANPIADIQFHSKRTGGTWELLASGITSEERAGEYNGKIRKSTLTLTADRLDAQAVFKCEVKDGLFQVEQTVTINVYFPPTVTISSTPKSVREGDILTLTCTARGGNPSSYSYKWFYKNKEIPNETSRDNTITNIKYTQSGTYTCQAANYSPHGKADTSLNIDIQYKAKWNPDLPEVFSSASKPNTPMKFVLHVIANPAPYRVTWFFPNMTTIGGAFMAAKVNDTTYTLSKTSVGVNDYGNYTVNVTNDVGISTFVFELEKAGPPDTPCCLGLAYATAVSLTLTFTSGFAGGSPQTFTVENRTSGGNVWDIAVKDIADPGFGNNVTQKISGLDSETNYKFRVKATNDDGDSDYGKILEVKTEATPNVSLTVERTDNEVTASWPKLLKEYTKIQIKYCPVEGGSCDYHDVPDPKSLKSSFAVKDGNTYMCSMIIFDGEDQVFASAVVLAPTSDPPAGAIGGAVGGVLFLLVITAVVLATFFILKKRRAEKGRESPPTGGDTAGLTGTPRTSSHIPDPVYVNIDNRAFESDAANCPKKTEPVYVNCPQNQPKGDDADLAEPEYDEPHHGCTEPKNDEAHQGRSGDQQERVQKVVYDDTKWTSSATDAAVAKKKLEDISVKDFKQWLLSKRVTESTYQILAKNGLNEAVIFALLDREADLKVLRIKPLGQEILVRKLMESFRLGTETRRGDGHRSGSGAAEEGADVEVENPYEELNVTPDVIADQVYTKLKPWQFSRADC